MEIDLALVELGVIMLTLAVLGRVAVYFELPTTPFFLAAGLFFGQGGIFPVEESAPFIEVGATLGVIFLLFMLGLEYTPKELRQSLRTNARGGLVDVVFNAAPGAIAALVLGWGAQAAVVLAGITYISSSGIIAKLLTDLRRLGNRETSTILSLLVIEDLVMAIFLPVLAVMLAGGSTVGAVLSGGAALGLVVTVIVLSPFAERHANRVLNTESSDVLLITLLGLAMLISGLAEMVHVSYAIGAFLLGIILSGQIAESARTLLNPLRDSFAALFFVNFGLGVESSALVNMIVPAVLLAIVGAITKLGTGWTAAKMAGASRNGARRAAVSMVPRGEFSIVLAGIGVAAGVTGDLKSLVVSYVLILAIGGSLLVRFVK
jgi:CPA2 family monovalent cation:H+ antiporter-2